MEAIQVEEVDYTKESILVVDDDANIVNSGFWCRVNAQWYPCLKKAETRKTYIITDGYQDAGDGWPRAD